GCFFRKKLYPVCSATDWAMCSINPDSVKYPALANKLVSSAVNPDTNESSAYEKSASTITNGFFCGNNACTASFSNSDVISKQLDTHGRMRIGHFRERLVI